MAAEKTTTRKATYNGIPATVNEIRGGDRPRGSREVRITWHADCVRDGLAIKAGQTTSKTIKGDFFKGTGETIIAQHIIDN